MENEKCVAIKARQQIAVTGEINAMIELGEYLLTSNRTTNTLVLYNMSLEEISRRVFTPGEFGTVKDMTKISSSRFAVLWSMSLWCALRNIGNTGWCELYLMELKDDLCGFIVVNKLRLARTLPSSICYQRNFVFAAVTPFLGESYIQMTSIEEVEHGPYIVKPAKREYTHILLSKSIRILDVYPDFVMYVCDMKHKHLYIFGKDTFSDSLMISEGTIHRYRVLDIARSAE
ncbi:hypothetical protein DPMN_121013 [Dreissena polymorpha]|uniref:Uncharacterized protein n=1 Tax=Dreissena polymorpha TaxID=45954 RepID=A0A9D4GLD6_DREPO|nr:hypothetical protein DPMN_121013 [Dreissena polymorpha]